jgi:TonB dependent receptor/CarboxypepD_reg-like domain/TonB-dependent Receptor Plug Domain
MKITLVLKFLLLVGISFLLLFLPSCALAQKKVTIRGVVKEKSTSETLIGSSIVLGAGKVAVSNDFGFYSLQVNEGKYTITVSSFGYKSFSREINLSEDLTIDFELEENISNLQEFVVKANTKNDAVESTEIGSTTLLVSTIKQLPAVIGEADILRAIQLLPGVSNTNEVSSGFNVRGGTADQNLILLDEATIYNATHLFGLFSVFNADAIKDVKLYKGGIPSIYGGRLSSVLEVKQKEGNKKKFQGEAGVGLISSRLLVEGPLSKVKEGESRGSYMFAGRRSYLDLFANLSKEFKDNKLYFYDLNLKTNYTINSKNRLYLSGYFGRDNFKLPSLVAAQWGNVSGTLRWTNNISNKLFFQTSAIVSRYDYSLDNLRSGYEFSRKSDITNINLKPRITWYLNANNTMKAGVDAISYTFKPGKIAPLKNSPIRSKEFQQNQALEVSAYADNEQKIGKNLGLQYGLRWSNFYRLGAEDVRLYQTGEPLRFDAKINTYANNQQIGIRNYGKNEVISQYNAFEPRVSMRYLLNERSSVKLGYNRMTQYIHLITNTTSPTPLDVWTPSGSYIKPQTSDQVSLGYFINPNGYEMTGEVYYKRTKNLTDFVDGADLLFNENIESLVAKGRGVSYGLEVQISKKEGQLTGWISYTLSQAKARIQGVNNNGWYASNSNQLHQLNLVSFYKLSKRWELSGNFIFGSGRPVTYPAGRYSSDGVVVADFSQRNTGRLPAYHRLDLSATLRPKQNSKRNGEWVFSVINVYNRLNASSIFFREIAEINGLEVASGTTEAIKTAFFPIIPSVAYNFKF